jgi:hypothetical protein
MNSSDENVVGFLELHIIKLLNLELEPGEIRLLHGGIKHIKDRRLDCYNKYKDKIPEIIKNPDYIGTHPKYLNSVEFIKKVGDNILVVIGQNYTKNLCVITMYDVTDSKIVTMLKYGRIKKLNMGT